MKPNSKFIELVNTWNNLSREEYDVQVANGRRGDPNLMDQIIAALHEGPEDDADTAVMTVLEDGRYTLQLPQTEFDRLLEVVKKWSITESHLADCSLSDVLQSRVDYFVNQIMESGDTRLLYERVIDLTEKCFSH